FAAGLILDPVHFRYFKDAKIVHDVKQALKDADASNEAIKQVNHAIEEHSHRHIEDLIEPLAFFLVPIFFVLTGMEVKLDSLFDGRVLLVALAITLVAIVGKILAGVASGKVNKLLVGCGMIPRGEVGLIFASIGKGLGVINDELFSVIVIMVILTTLLTPPILSVMLKRIGK
ncbi:cation:proton antiporter, partial [Patescibacteria group bacterium]|nr:cation:proton antiporter [Patescibacteria group bacterium]